MKKKLWIVLLLAIFATFLIGCNPGGSDLDINYDQVADAPTNLAISGKILTWNAVDEAKAYVVYVNGSEKTTVKTNRYDFSSISGDVLIFQVMSDAERGYQDSGLSAKLAYVANYTTELQTLNTLVNQQFIACPDGFAEALLEKGMVSSDFTGVQGKIDDFLSAMVSPTKDIISISNAIQALIDSGINYEALINGLVLYLPKMIEDEIKYYQDDIDYYTELIDEYGYYGYYQDNIDEDQAQIDMYQAILDTFNASKEEVVLSAVHTLDYFVSIFDQLDTEFFTNIQNIANVDSPSQFDTNEILLVKDEISSAMLDNMPSLSDMTILFELVSALSQAMTSTKSVLTYPTENAAELLLSIEFFAKMIDTIDANYINSIKGFASNPESANIETLILSIKYFDTFQQDNDGLIKEMRKVLTYDQQKAMYDSYLAYMNDMTSTEAIDFSGDIFQRMNFEDVYQLKDFAYRLMDPVLEWFTYTNGDILRYMDEQNRVYEGVSYTVGSYQAQLLSVRTMKELCGLLYVITGEVEDDDKTAIAGMLSTLIPYSENSILSSNNISLAEYNALVDDMQDALNSEIMTLVDLVHSLCNYALSENFFDDFIDLEADINQYAINKYGVNYKDSSSGFSSDRVPYYARVILVANLVDGFMTRSNTGKVEDIANLVFDIMGMPTFLKASGYSATYIANQRDAFMNNFDDFLTDMHTIKGYNAFDLSNSQKEYIEAIPFYIPL